MTTLALCMAGLYRRFREAGYTTPKFLLPLEDERTILAHIVEQLAPERLLLVANKRDESHAAAIQAAAPSGVLKFIGDTEGQAQTAEEAARLALEQGWDGPFVLHNVDTILFDRDLKAIGQILSQHDGFIDVFDADSAAYSYVRVDDDNRVLEMAEKVVISRHATTGLYGFSSPADYLSAASRTTSRSKGEFYVSDVYGQMLSEGADIRIDPKPRETVILGTPGEYEGYLQRR